VSKKNPLLTPITSYATPARNLTTEGLERALATLREKDPGIYATALARCFVHDTYLLTREADEASKARLIKAYSLVRSFQQQIDFKLRDEAVKLIKQEINDRQAWLTNQAA
jgi:predicted transcriptional regulator